LEVEIVKNILRICLIQKNEFLLLMQITGSFSVENLLDNYFIIKRFSISQSY